MAAIGYKIVGRLDVTVKYSLGVGSVQSVGHVDSNIKKLLKLHRPAMACLRVLPSRYYIAMKSKPFSSPIS